MHKKYCSESLKRRDRFKDLDVDGRIILKWILEKLDVKVCSGLICLRI
jgi:hypothetical protein